MSKILIPVDGSDSASRALAYAVELKKQDQSIELLILNVQQPNLYSSLMEGISTQFSMQNMLLEQGEAILAYHAQALEKHQIEFDQSIKLGRVEDVICAQAKAEGAERIIMGRNGIQQGSYLFGSVAYPVVLGSSIPVTLIQ